MKTWPPGILSRGSREAYDAITRARAFPFMTPAEREAAAVSYDRLKEDTPMTDLTREEAKDELTRMRAQADQAAAEGDIEVQGGSEFMVTGCYGLTPAGNDFIDAYVPGGDFMEVVDVGRIVLPDVHMPRFREQVLAAGLRLVDTTAQV